MTEQKVQKIYVDHGLGFPVQLSSAFVIAGSAAQAGDMRVYRIDVKNATAGNVLSPFLAAAVQSGTQIAQIGAAASPGVAALAETGDRTPLIKELNDAAMAIQIASAEGGPILPGETRSVEISLPTSSVKMGAKLVVLAMIGRSNDSFITLDGFPLDRIGSHDGSPITLTANNYDAGSEENSGNVEDFGTGGHPTGNLEGIISFDRGLNPRGNAPDIFGWGPTAAI